MMAQLRETARKVGQNCVLSTLKGMARVRRVRMWDWMVATVVLLLLLALISPQNLPVVIYKAMLVSLSVVAAYWADNRLYQMLSTLKLDATLTTTTLGAARIISRAIVFLGCIIGFTLGL